MRIYAVMFSTLMTMTWMAPQAWALRILSSASRWDNAHRTIFTDSLVLHDDGQMEMVTVPGGSVDGIGMVQFDLRLGGVSGQVLDFVRSETKGGTPLKWAKSCVYITPDAAGTSDLTGDKEFDIIESVLANWEDKTKACGYMTFVRDPHKENAEVGYDGVNVIKFRETTWCRPAPSTSPSAAPTCYDPQAAGLTTLFFVDKPGQANDGTILDADVELNCVDFAMGAGGVSKGTGSPADLANTLTHEIGHLIGLDHTCWDRAGTPPDGIPSCQSALPPSVTEATMYNFQAPGETKKTSLEQDDIDGFCAIYPKNSDPNVCERARGGDSSGCRVGETDSPSSLLDLAPLLLAAGLWIARKKLA